MDPTSQLVMTLCVALITLAAAVWDYRTKKIPNALTVPVFAAGILFHLIRGLATGGLTGAGSAVLFSLAGFATGFGILFVLWLIGGGGGGDVKLMAALGAWLGPTLILGVFLVSVVIVLVYSTVVLFWHATNVGLRRTKGHVGGTVAPEAAERRVARRIMPYAVPVAVATWCVLAYPMLKEFLVST